MAEKQDVRNSLNLNHSLQDCRGEKNKFVFFKSLCFGASLPKKPVAPGEDAGKKQNVSLY